MLGGCSGDALHKFAEGLEDEVAAAKEFVAARRQRKAASPKPPDTSGADKPAPKPKPSCRDNVPTLAALQRKTFEPVKAIVAGLIVEGLNILALRPELGKSWMIYDICIAASANRYTLGNIKPLQGDVLYLALEDSERRLQSRADKLLPTFNGKWPERMTVSTQWRRIDGGCIEDKEEWCASVPNPVLIVVDTFAKVRPANPPKGKSQYDVDYDAVSKLRKFAIKRGIAVVLIHHERKMGADDPFDTFSGTHGLTGAADTLLMFKRAASGCPRPGCLMSMQNSKPWRTYLFAARADTSTCRSYIVRPRELPRMTTSDVCKPSTG
jgi:hypothetical protein